MPEVRRLAPVLLLVVACGGGSNTFPGPTSPGTTRAAPSPSASAARADEGTGPPWRRKVSVADGYEGPRPSAPAVVIQGATLLLGNGSHLDKGTVVLQGGRITAVQKEPLATIPQGAQVVDGTGKFVTPGLIDTHSHLGVYPMPQVAAHDDGNEATDPSTPYAQTADGFWPQDPGIERAVAGGVTTLQVLPGSANLIGGRAVTLKLRPGPSSRAMHFPGAPDGLKMACGENPKRVYGKTKRTPSTRMGNLAMQRAAFLKARRLIQQWDDWRTGEDQRQTTTDKKRATYEAKVRAEAAKGRVAEAAQEPDPSRPALTPDRDPGLETLAAALEGRVLVQVHCYRADDMMAMLALSDEMGFQVRSFHHAVDAYKIRGDLARRGVSVSTWADWWGFKMEAWDAVPENVALLATSGVRPALHSDSPEGIQRLNQEAAKALWAGRRAGLTLEDDEAIRWITSEPAWVLGIDRRVGTLEVGKDADLVLWDRNPLSFYASAEKVWIDGAVVFERGRAPWSDFEVGALPGLTSLNASRAKAIPAPMGSTASPATPLPAPWPDAPASRPFLVTGTRVLTGNGEVVEDATVTVRNGVVVSVTKGKVGGPSGVDVLDGAGTVLTPGFTDVLTSVGLVEVDLEEATHDDVQAGGAPVRAGYRAADGFNPASVVIPVARLEGITSVVTIPRGGLISGQSAWADLTGDGGSLVAVPAALHVHVEGTGPGGHGEAFLRVREAFDDARAFQRSRGAWERNQSRPFAPSRLDLEAMQPALGGRIPVVFHVNRAPDIVAVLRLARELGLHAVIAGGAEAWRVAPELAAAKVPVVLLPLLAGPETFDHLGARPDNAALLEAAGVPVVISTGETHHARRLRQAAGNAVRAGLSPAAALAAVTRRPAEILGLGARYGTVTVGKVANLVVWSGDPFEVGSRPLSVVVRGARVPLRSRQTALFEKYRGL